MTTTQKIIKYLAIAFALFLVISIFSIIFGLSREIISSINSDKKDSKLLEEYTTISNNVNNIESFKIDISNDNIEIKEGEKFEVKTNDPDVKFYHDNSKVKIKTDKTFSWHLSNSSRGTIIIYLLKHQNHLILYFLNLCLYQIYNYLYFDLNLNLICLLQLLKYLIQLNRFL